jgi:hypothetical protein
MKNRFPGIASNQSEMLFSPSSCQWTTIRYNLQHNLYVCSIKLEQCVN